jgi:imidazole glycerol-phosphate synthase subunit HisH
MTQKITIIDYGSGNLRSVFNALNLIDGQNFYLQISSNPEDIKNSDKIILPGVGAFANCINSLSNITKMRDILQEEILHKKKNFLGICVGMQLLADFGNEYETVQGLGFISGEIIKINDQDQTLKIPHIGWNEIQIKKNHDILQNIANNEHFYFVHSYHFLVKDSENIIANVNYGQNLAAIIAKDNIVATQFHPEKSGASGMKLLKNFITL